MDPGLAYWLFPSQQCTPIKFLKILSFCKCLCLMCCISFVQLSKQLQYEEQGGLIIFLYELEVY